MTRLTNYLARINDAIAVCAGLLLLTAVGVTLVDVMLRALRIPSLGGTDELSGYAMAVATAWGVSYALSEQAHVRIDLLRKRLVAPGRAMLDLLAMGALAAVAVMIAWRGWGVLSGTLSTNAQANTALATPLWIPQSMWWIGWGWFAVTACLLLVVGAVHLAFGNLTEAEDLIGAKGETEL